MMEYAGIDASRLEAMEERLKKDVLAEVRRLYRFILQIVANPLCGGHLGVKRGERGRPWRSG